MIHATRLVDKTIRPSWGASMTISMNFSGLSALSQKRFINLTQESSPRPATQVPVRTAGNISVSTAAESMSRLASAVAGLGGSETFLATAVASSDRDVVRVSTSGKAPVGQHTVEITQMATKQVTTATTGYTNSTDVVADGGSISFSVNGSTTAAISISSSTTLTELKDQINNQNSGVVCVDQERRNKQPARCFESAKWKGSGIHHQ